jgi:hypothetical protein
MDNIKNENLELKSLELSSEAGLGTPIITSGYSTNGMRYLPYSSISKRYPTHNTYPQMLIKLAMESPTHSAAINIKSLLTSGDGFDKTNLSRNVKKVLNYMNNKNQSIDDILEQVAQDYVTFGGFALKVCWNTGGQIYAVERIFFTDVRCGEPDEDGYINYYVISNNWDLTMPTKKQITYSLPVFNPKIFEGGVKIENGVPSPSDEQMQQGEQIIYYYKQLQSPSSNGMYFYPVPDYVAGIDCILQEVDINTSNKSLINNGLGGKTIINVPAVGLNEDVKRKYHQDTVKYFTGASNNGGLVINFGEDFDRMPTYTTLPSLDADTYLNVKEQIIQTIVTVHNIPGILLNLRSGGAWSNTADEMEQAYQIFNRTKIAKYQQAIERVFNTILGYMGYDVELQIIPFSINNAIDVISDEVVKSEQVSNTNVETTSLDSK